MIQYYQELLNECLDLKRGKELHKNMKSILNKMKNNLKKLKGASDENFN